MLNVYLVLMVFLETLKNQLIPSQNQAPVITLIALFRVAKRVVWLHNSDEIIRILLPNEKAYTVLARDGGLYILSIISEANYRKMVNNLPEGYIVTFKDDYQTFYYIGKELPPIVIVDHKRIYKLLDTEWLALQETSTVFSLKCSNQIESSLT